ncbi:MAG: NERD domain-containing protein [Anaerolineales bacterium]|nr:NERD domain-containing protein [Anaerolineales bacterium]
MAVLIPEDISAMAVPSGERKFHSFLKILFESRPDVIGWHSVRVCGKEIDFALLLPGIGLFVIEVKDWKHRNILSTGPADFILRTEQGEETKISPYVQARECGYKVREGIQREPLLCQSSGPKKGKPILPVGHIVVFATIPGKKAQAGPHAARLDPQSTLFEEDLANDGPYLAHPKEGLKTFLEFARRALPIAFPSPTLSGPQVEALKKRVFSDSVIKMVDPTQRRQSRKVGEVAMDHLQEKYAREIGGGPRLLKGVAGSGKTLVLLQRAIYKARYDPSAKRILFTCYNLSLANHVRDMVEHNVPEDRRARINVKPFFDLCGDILSEIVEQEGKNTEYYDDIVSRAGARVVDMPENEKYDVILLDEGQDFSPAMFHVVLSLHRPERDDIMIALDTEQDLYGRFSLKKMGIDFRGRTHMLPSSYRSTQQIFEYAHRLTGKALPPAVDSETGQMFVFPQYAGRTGSAPIVETFPDPDRLVSHLVTEIRHHIQAEKIPPAEIGILYLSKRRGTEPTGGAASTGGKKTLQSFEQLKGMVGPAMEEKSLPNRITSSLKGAGIPVNWFTENSAAKQSFDLHEPTVKIGTIHSAKGLDFEVVYLIDATGNPVGPPSKGVFGDDAAQKYRNLLFVGCTRARDQLFVLIGSYK